MVEHLPIMCEVLGSIPCTSNNSSNKIVMEARKRDSREELYRKDVYVADT